MNTKLNLSGKIYDNIGTITFYNRTFVFIKNGNDVKVVEIKKVENTLRYVMPSFKFGLNNLVELKENYIAISIASSIKNDITLGKITDKNDLVLKLANAENILKNDQTINGFINSKEQNLDEFRKQVKNLLSYFDNKMKEQKPNMNLQNVSSFQIENKDGFRKEYIKKTDGKGNIEILENIDDKNFDKQFKDTQNEFTSLGLQNGLQSADDTFNWMRDHDKVNVGLNKMDDIHELQDKSTENGFNAMNSEIINNSKRDLVANPDSDIYIDKKTGDVLTTKVEGNHVDVVRVHEREAKTEDNIEQKDIYIPELNQDNLSLTSENSAVASDLNNNDSLNNNSSEITDLDLSTDEIEKILIQYKDKLTDEQIAKLENKLAQMKEFEQQQKVEDTKKQSMPKRLSLILNDKQAAFSDVFMLCIIADIGVLGLLLGVLYLLK